jgi:uncharacterized OB-fold protein
MTVGPVSRNEATESFFDGTDRGVFLLRRCPDGHFSRPQAGSCEVCGSEDLEDAPASGRARLVSWVVVPARPVPGDEGPPPAPAMPAIVELEEGPWWWTSLVDADPARLTDGHPLEVRFERPEGSEAVPVFAPVQPGE